MVVIAGPDGTGKSALADTLAEELARRGAVRRFHHRLAILPRSAAGRRASSAPHAAAPYPKLVSQLKVLYLFLDHLLGWVMLVRSVVGQGGWVVVERGWWDIVVDPRRYRLTGVRRLAERLGRRLPQPDATLILEASPTVVRARKEELTAGEVLRQSGAWRRLALHIPGAVFIDASQPPDAVLSAAIGACCVGPDVDTGRSSAERRWVPLPPGPEPRWLIPSDSRRLARAGLSVHQPMTAGGRAGWEAARFLAGAGLIGLLPNRRDPSLTRAVWRFIPPGGTFAAAYGREASRAVVLILDADGKAFAVAKIARDAAGRDRLRREVESIRLLGPRLEAPLSPPRLLADEEDVLLFEPVGWHPQPRPWRLSTELAVAMGHFHAKLVRVGDRVGHPGHGDFAPWNILRTHVGWVLVDWEEASANAPPLADPFHYLVSTHTLLGRPREGELLRGLAGEGWVGEALQSYVTAAAVSVDVRAAFAEYLQSSMASLRPLHPHSERGRRSRQRLLRAVRSAL